MTLFSSYILTHIYKRLYGCLVLPRRCMPVMFPFRLEVENDLHLLCTNGFSLKISCVSTFFLTDEDYFKLFVFGHGAKRTSSCLFWVTHQKDFKLSDLGHPPKELQAICFGRK